MGRPASPLPADKIEPALAYLQRALDRSADIFRSGTKETSRSLARLRKQALTLRQADLAAEVNAWLAVNVTPAGRRLMLASLRQQLFAQKAPSPSRLPTGVQQDLARLAEAVRAPQPIALRCLLRIALADDSVLARVRALAAEATADA
jgi:hypothetical protein